MGTPAALVLLGGLLALSAVWDFVWWAGRTGLALAGAYWLAREWGPLAYERASVVDWASHVDPAWVAAALDAYEKGRLAAVAWLT